jgi:DNA replication protein DnaC
VRYLSAAELVETLYRGMADNSVGRLIDTLLRNDIVLIDEVGFAPLDPTGTQLLFRFVAAALRTPRPRDRVALGVQRLGPLPTRTHHAASMLDRLLHHAVVIVTDGDSYRMRTRGGGPNT